MVEVTCAEGLRGWAHRVMRRLAIMAWFRSVPGRLHVRFLGRGRLYFDASDNRAKWLRSSAGVTQPLLTWVWQTLVRKWRPDVVVDVGANYGEIALCCAYREQARIVLVEANPALLPYLRRSCASHRNAEQIKIFDFFAGDTDGPVSFVIDEKWSGTSSGVAAVEDAPFKGPGPQRTRRVDIRSSRLEPHLARLLRESDRRLLVKIDVEGSELKVLQGLEGILRDMAEWILILEHNPSALKAGGVTTRGASNVYHALGSVFAWSAEGRLESVEPGIDVGPKKVDIILCHGPTADLLLAGLRRPPILRLRSIRQHRDEHRT
jgi:FkbM family methyltransferase